MLAALQQQKILQNLCIILMFVGFLLTPLAPLLAQTPGLVGDTAEESAAAAKAVGQNDNTGRVQNSVKLNIGKFEGFMYNFTTGIGGTFLWLGGLTFDYSINRLVVGMGKLFKEGGLEVAINDLWVIVRDIFNLIFIFSLIYIGFKTILNSEDSGTRRALGTLIAAALLINFSLYATKIVVDVTNLAASQIYDLIQIDGAYNSSFFGVGQVKVTGIAGIFMDYTDLTSYSNATTETLNSWSSGNSAIPSIKIIGFGFLVMIFMLVAAFVFFAGAFLMISRFIGLIFFMIFSPAMFLGLIYPGFKSLTAKWWKMFLNYSIMAPAFLLMLYFSLTLISKLGIVGTENPGLANAFSGQSSETGVFTIFLNYFIIIGFLIASLKIAQSLGVAGANQVIKVGHALRRTGQSYVGANTVGLGASVLSKGYNRYESSKFAQSTAGKSVRALANIATLGATTDRSVNMALKAGTSAKFGGSDSYDSLAKEGRERGAELSRVRKVRDLTNTLKSGSEEEVQRALANASSSQVLEVAKNKGVMDIIADRPAGNILLEHAANMKSSQVTKVMDSDDFTDDFKSSLGTAVSVQTLAKFAGDTDREIHDATKDELGAIGFEGLNDIATAVQLTGKQVEHLESVLTASDAAAVKDLRKEGLIEVAKGTTIGNVTYAKLTERKPEEIAKLPNEALEAMAEDLSTAAIKKITETRGKDDQKLIRAKLEKIAKKPGKVRVTKNGKTTTETKPREQYTHEEELWEYINVDNIGKHLAK